MKKICLPFIALFLFWSCINEKTFDRIDRKINSRPIEAKYTGGHYWDITLVLYKDGKYLYVVVPDFGFFVKKKRGKYVLGDDYIRLQGMGTFRRSDNKVMLFSQRDEDSDDGDFYKAYYTLTLAK